MDAKNHRPVMMLGASANCVSFLARGCDDVACLAMARETTAMDADEQQPNG